MTDRIEALVALGERVVAQAQKAGATVAEATVREGSHLSTKVRMREPELVEEAGSRAVGLRVMLGQQVAVTYTSDLVGPGPRTARRGRHRAGAPLAARSDSRARPTRPSCRSARRTKTSTSSTPP